MSKIENKKMESIFFYLTYFQEKSKNFITYENLDDRIAKALENPIVYDYAIDMNGKKFYLPKPVKFLEGTPTQQKGRLYDMIEQKQSKQV